MTGHRSRPVRYKQIVRAARPDEKHPGGRLSVIAYAGPAALFPSERFCPSRCRPIGGRNTVCIAAAAAPTAHISGHGQSLRSRKGVLLQYCRTPFPHAAPSYRGLYLLLSAAAEPGKGSSGSRRTTPPDILSKRQRRRQVQPGSEGRLYSRPANTAMACFTFSRMAFSASSSASWNWT